MRYRPVGASEKMTGAASTKASPGSPTSRRKYLARRMVAYTTTTTSRAVRIFATRRSSGVGRDASAVRWARRAWIVRSGPTRVAT